MIKQNFIEKLLDGVEVENKKIKDIASVLIGEFVHKNKQKDDAEYPVYNGGTSYTGFYNEFNRTKDKIIISARGANAGYVNRVFTNFWSGNSCYTIDVFDDKVDWNYLYYYIKDRENSFLDGQQKGGIPAVSKKQVEQFDITIPPLKVQTKIVRILDAFTELTAELTARKKQYDYYRDKLFSFEDEEVEWKTLGEVAEYSKNRISFEKLDENNYVGVDNLLQNREGKTISTRVPKKGNSTQYNSNDILIGNIRPYLKKIWFSDRTGGTNGDVLVINIINKFIKPRFLYQVLADDKFFDYNMQHAKGAKMPRGNKNRIMEYLIPIPYPNDTKKSLEEQERIVSILDKFEALTTSISEGLPREIELRQKQYEYYRNMLLSFSK